MMPFLFVSVIFNVLYFASHTPFTTGFRKSRVLAKSPVYETRNLRAFTAIGGKHYPVCFEQQKDPCVL